MSQKLAPGLMRLNRHGEIVPCNYDFDTRQIGHVVVSLPIAFSEPFLPATAVWTWHDLWKALVSFDETLAVILVNNTFLVSVSQHSLIIQRKTDRGRPQIAVADTQLLFRPVTPVGFVRTCPAVKDVNVPPYRLFMDGEQRVSVGGGAPRLLSDAVKCTDMSMYKTLISTSKSAIYMSSSGPKFL